MSDSFKLHIPEILLADDDNEDCVLFQDALNDCQLATNLTTVRNGQELMDLLRTCEQLPDALFLDINMPRKSGYECLVEIRKQKRLDSLPVIIITTSTEEDVIDLVYEKGAQYYICKPTDYRYLVNFVRVAITLITQRAPGKQLPQPQREKFVLSRVMVTKT